MYSSLVDFNGICPDYVFAANYKLLSVKELENFVKQNQHLPEVPSAKEVEQKGINVGEWNITMLKKIEELTLYVIEQNKQIEELKTKVNTLQIQTK